MRKATTRLKEGFKGDKKDKGAGENTGLPLKPDQQVQELRSQAERVIRQQDALPPVDVGSLTFEKSQKLLQELQVHQVELTMQNDELRASQVGLEESRSRYFELYDLASVGYLTVNEQGFITLANLTFATLLGVKRSALDNKPLSRYILKEDQDIYYRHRKKLFESGEDQQCELRMVKADGGEFWAKLRGNFVPVKDGGPFCRLTLSDITESKKAEEEIRFQAKIIENSPMIAAYHDKDLNMLWVNRAYEKATGLSLEECRGRKCYQVWNLSKPCRGCPVITTIETGESAASELTPDNQDHWPETQGCWLSEAAPVRDEQGAIIGALEFAIDITERKAAEEALRKSEERFRVAQDISPDGFTILHPLRNEKGEIIDFTWVYENKAVARINETDPQKVIGKRLLDLFPDHSGTPIFEAYIHVANTGEPQIFEEVYVGEEVSGPTWLRMVIVPMAEEIAILAMDISERKQAEQRVKERTIELEAVNKELESFAYSISHDFRAPLRALNAFSASLTEKYNDQLDEQGLHYLNRINKASLYMSDLVDDLLSLSRITRVEMNQQEVDISQTAEEIIQGLQIAEPERQVKVAVAQGLSAKGDVALLKDALANLIDNAWKFSSKEEQAEIEVGLTTIDGEEAFFVRDNGVGFNMAYADKLFGAFQRLHKVDEFSGTGIGLATVQRIINRHGGRTWAESEVGKGATFYFTLK